MVDRALLASRLLMMRLAIIAAALVACTNAPATDPSAGSVPGEATEPLLSAEPLIVVGFSEADDDALFHRITAAALLADGSFVVADGSRTMRVFASDGGLRNSFGRAGSGPGEFAGIARIWAHPGTDTITVWDLGNNRLSTWEPADGPPVAEARIDLPFRVLPGGRFVDGSYLVIREGMPRRMEPGEAQEVTAQLYRYRPDGLLEELVTLPYGRYASGVSAMGQGAMMVPQPFSQPPLTAVADTFFFWAGTGSGHVAKYSWSGTLMDSLTVFPVVAVTGADRERMIERNLAGVPPDNRPGVRRFLESLPLPEQRAAYGALLVDDRKRLWVQAHADPDAERGDWVVLAADGRELFRGWMPGGLEARSVRDGRVLASTRDSQGREGIALWQVAPSATSDGAVDAAAAVDAATAEPAGL